jgi:hypothetical protein
VLVAQGLSLNRHFKNHEDRALCVTAIEKECKKSRGQLGVSAWLAVAE